MIGRQFGAMPTISIWPVASTYDHKASSRGPGGCIMTIKIDDSIHAATLQSPWERIMTTEMPSKTTFKVTIWHCSGARFTNGSLPTIQIRLKLRLAITPLLAIRSQQSFAHATTAQLSCHVQNFVALTVLESRWGWNEFFIEFELRW